MLTKFIVSNFKNFENNFVFDLTDIKNYEFNNECINNNTINKSIIYGPNGCGKSNLGFAIMDLVYHLTDNHNLKDRDYKNYLNAFGSKKQAEFYYQFKFEDSTVEYFYSKSTLDVLIYEKLLINGREVVSIDRTKDSIAKVNLKGAESLKTDLSQSKISIIKYIKNNTILDENDENAIFQKFLNFTDHMLFFRSVTNRHYGQELNIKRISEGILKRDLLNDFEVFLNKAGIICSLDVLRIDGLDLIAFKFGDKKIEFSEIASTGTFSLGFFYYWLQKLKENTLSFVFIDEFDAFYHHNLSKLVVEEVKKSSAQVIMTTHNTGIMSNDLLRPDCYFLMQNNELKPIFKFSEKELRKAHNIEKMYKAGVFDE